MGWVIYVITMAGKAACLTLMDWLTSFIKGDAGNPARDSSRQVTSPIYHTYEFHSSLKMAGKAACLTLMGVMPAPQYLRALRQGAVTLAKAAAGKNLFLLLRAFRVLRG
jgi:hypothetical protein